MNTIIERASQNPTTRTICIGLLCLFPFLVILLGSQLQNSIGFPLDDAWIHQTYARNFLQTLSWEYNSGQVSAGSTSPLWTLLLVPGHMFTSNFFYIWTYGISLLFFGASSFLFSLFLNDKKFPSKTNILLVLLFSLEWHVLWAVVSGMETVLYIFFSLLIFYFLKLGKHYSWWLGILLGGILWVRPDGITLWGPVGLIIFVDLLRGYTEKPVYKIIGPFLISLALYFLFNFSISGSIFPNTFYAKQTEYAVLYNSPLINRFFSLVLVPLTGVGIVLLPGFIAKLISSVRSRDIVHISAGLWVIGYIGLYAWRLPVTYQHGRYIIPVIPIFLLIGVSGWLESSESFRGLIGRIIKKSWGLIIVIVLIGFSILGVQAYSRDVAIIETEMVYCAKWIRDNTSHSSIIAAHDIGALGFFSDRTIIDMAGLISPEVIPFIRDEEMLAKFLDDQKADYLMTFPNWYPELIKDKTMIFSSMGNYAPLMGGENINVYEWK
jgi:hypothetical protein